VYYNKHISSTNHYEREKMRNAVVIGFDTDLSVIDLDAPEGALDILQKAVDGYVQAIDLTPTMTMWCNEEGKLDGLPNNAIATAIFQEKFGAVDIIVGNAVITGGVDDEGETIGLTAKQVERLEHLFS
jgi:hypothetical protein